MVDESRLYAVPPSQPSAPVSGTAARFPVRRIYCVGRNYPEHLREMGDDTRALPFFFQKPSDAVVASGSTIAYPPATSDFQHEIELVLAVGREGHDIPRADAAAHVFGIAVGIDLTRRDLQLAASRSGGPWESGKAFDASAPLSAIHPLRGAALPAAGRISLRVNGSLKQEGNLRDMVWKPDEIVQRLSCLFVLEPGDLIFTGTPAGVGKLVPGDHVIGEIENLGSVSITVASRI